MPTLTTDLLTPIRELYHAGHFLQAFEAGKALGPLASWEGTEARVLAGRLAMNLGGARLGVSLHLRAHRDDPENAEALYYYVFALLSRRGPLRAWQVLRTRPDLPEARPELRADWLALHAGVVGSFRDFDAAEHWLAQADRIAPGRPWLWIERARLLELEDRYEEALAAARRALELRAWYRPAVECAAHVLVLLSRDEEALELLRAGGEHIESSHLPMMRAHIEIERRDFAAALASLDRFRELALLLDRDAERWFTGLRSDVLWNLGRIDEALELARRSKSPFHEKLVERVAQAKGTRRVLLPVGFVRQHWKTCSPATLSAIGGYWKRPVGHLEVTEKICYDGTPSTSERRWAEEHDWTTREFTVTLESAQALLDREVPFVFMSVAPGNAHAQAVIGYDERRGTLLVRDPTLRGLGEWVAEPVLASFRSTGPRGMALVPKERSALLDGVALPDAELWDDYYALERALDGHDRKGALEAQARLAAKAPDHRLAWSARRAIAAYDADPAAVLAAVEKLLALYPGDGFLELHHVACLRDLGRREERAQLLEKIVAARTAAPIFTELLAEELSSDERLRGRVQRLSRRALRRNPLDPRALSLLANSLWSERRTEEALELYRFAACLGDKDEGLALAYFEAAHRARQTGAGIFFLESRFQRFARRSGSPGRTLFFAYTILSRGNEAFAALDRALAHRGDDGELLLFAADAHARHGKLPRARSLLELAKDRTKTSAWRRAAATIASFEGELEKSLGLWLEVTAEEPLALDAHREAARLLAETRGRAEAVAHVERALGRFPHHVGLRRLALAWLAKGDDPSKHEAMLRRHLETDPDDAWTRRELAATLARTGRHADALAEAERALALSPREAASHGVRGDALARAGRRAEARAALREALRLEVEYKFAIVRLADLGATPEERREDLAFVRAELVRQASAGDAVLLYRDVASGVVPDEELLATLRTIQEERPDLWSVRSALVTELVRRGRLDEALAAARAAVERFPFRAQLWGDLALVERGRGDRVAEKAALERALVLAPTFGPTVRQLVHLHERAGELDKAQRLLEAALARSPLDDETHAHLATLLVSLGQRDRAIEHAERALRQGGGREGPWNLLRDLTTARGEPGRAAALARELASKRAGDGRAWLVLAQVLSAPSEREECLAAVERAIAADATSVDAHDMKAERLAAAGRFDEARAACSPAVFGGAPPLPLRGRAAWIEGKAGRVEQAILAMRKLVAESPGYAFGWQCLIGWCRERRDAKGHLEAADGLLRCDPHSAVALAWRGEARLALEDRPGARADLVRALELDPSAIFAPLLLFQLQLEDGDVAGAERTLALSGPFMKPEFRLARTVHLEAKKGRQAGALAPLEALAKLPLKNKEALNLALGGVPRDWTQQVDALLERVSASGQASAVASSLLAERLAARKELREARNALGRLTVGSPEWAEGAAALVQAAADTRSERLFDEFRAAHAEALHGATLAWGIVGFALLQFRREREAVSWLDGWAARPDARPWMISNLAYALRRLGDDATAAKVTSAGLALRPDHGTPSLAAWAAFDAALAGDAERARSLLPRTEAGRRAPSGTDGLAAELARAVLDAAAGDHGRARLRRLAALKLAPGYRQDAALAGAHRKAVARMAELRGGIAGALWRAWVLVS
jgi:tetratricopeptide (TPR) repeat protein